MNAVIVFDVSSHLPDVRSAMILKGYHAKWVTNNIIYNLPLNFLWKPDTELSTAQKDLEDVILNFNSVHREHEVKLSRCITLSATPWGGIVGEPC